MKTERKTAVNCAELSTGLLIIRSIATVLQSRSAIWFGSFRDRSCWL